MKHNLQTYQGRDTPEFHGVKQLMGALSRETTKELMFRQVRVCVLALLGGKKTGINQDEPAVVLVQRASGLS